MRGNQIKVCPTCALGFSSFYLMKKHTPAVVWMLLVVVFGAALQIDDLLDSTVTRVFVIVQLLLAACLLLIANQQISHLSSKRHQLAEWKRIWGRLNVVAAKLMEDPKASSIKDRVLEFQRLSGLREERLWLLYGADFWERYDADAKILLSEVAEWLAQSAVPDILIHRRSSWHEITCFALRTFAFLAEFRAYQENDYHAAALRVIENLLSDSKAYLDDGVEILVGRHKLGLAEAIHFRLARVYHPVTKGF